MTGRRAAAAWAAAAAVGLAAASFALLSGPSSPARSAPSGTVAAGAPAPAASATVRPTSAPVAQPAAATKTAAPARLQIPAIGVDSRLLSLGQATDGSLQVPAPGPDYDRAGWYRYSPTPGSKGPAVIVGHVNSARTGPSVFSRLGSLHTGDQVQVTGTDDEVITFTVTRLLRVAKASFPTQLVYGDTQDAALRLITCGGALNKRTGHYEDNIIVMATRTRELPAGQAVALGIGSGTGTHQ